MQPRDHNDQRAKPSIDVNVDIEDGEDDRPELEWKQKLLYLTTYKK